MILKMMKKTGISLLIAWICVVQVNHAKEPARIISGWIENIRIENLDFKVKAKLDTGAKTSSIHAKNIEPFSKDGQKWVRFSIVLKNSKNDDVHVIRLEKKRIRSVRIKNHDGEDDKRYVVMLDMCFNGRTYTSEFNLSNRKEFLYDVLLGRKFLKDTAIVDAHNTFLTVAECENN